jgi:hypothetical protein
MNSKNAERFAKRPGRKIVVAGVEWKWQLGRRGGVIAYSELGERKQDHASKIKRIDPDTWDRGQYKISSDGQLTPKEISEWLMKGE